MLSKLLHGAVAVSAANFLQQSTIKTETWDPKIEKDEVNSDEWKVEEKKECRCPDGQFWYAVPKAPQTGACIPKFGVGAECGWFPGDVRPRVCQAGLECQGVEHDDNYGGFGKPATCRAASGKVKEGEEPASNKCVHQAIVTGKVCAKVKVAEQVCEKSQAADVQATAQASADAEAVVKAPPVKVVGEYKGVKASVEVPVEKKVQAKVDVKTTAKASVEATAKATGESGEIEVCIDVDQAKKKLGVKDDVLTPKQAEELKKAASEMAHSKAMNEALEKAGKDACKEAKAVATKEAQEEAQNLAKEAAQEKAQDMAEEQAQAQAGVDANDPAKKQLSPDQYKKAKIEADALAKKASDEAAAQAAANAEATAQAAVQAKEAQATAAAGAAANQGAPAPNVGTPEAPTAGVKQTQDDVNAQLP